MPTPFTAVTEDALSRVREVDEYEKAWEDHRDKMIAEDPLNSQVGGAHYKQYKIQPIEYAMANKLNYCQANAIKYVTRYRDKNGLEDLRKAIHNIEILIKLEYGAESP